jgi:hypothetical protein
MPRTEFRITQKGDTIASSTVETKVAICDFCSRPVGSTCFIAKDATMDIEPEQPHLLSKIQLNSDSHWAACDPCAVLVRANDKQGLYERSAENAPPGIEPVFLLALQAAMFWAVYDGASHRGADHPEHPEHRSI